MKPPGTTTCQIAVGNMAYLRLLEMRPQSERSIARWFSQILEKVAYINSEDIIATLNTLIEESSPVYQGTLTQINQRLADMERRLGSAASQAELPEVATEDGEEVRFENINLDVLDLPELRALGTAHRIQAKSRPTLLKRLREKQEELLQK